MPRFEVMVRVMTRPTLLDPEGQTVEHALHALGFEGVDAVRVGKSLTIALAADDEDAARAAATVMCERLLANPVTEDFTIHVTGAP